MNFQDDFLFAKPVKSAIISDDIEVFYLNGTATQHNAFGKLIGNENTRQQGWQNCVYELAANPDGTLRYKGSVLKSEFEKHVDRNTVREYGMAILGLKDDSTEFDEMIEDELGNFETESEDLAA